MALLSYHERQVMLITYVNLRLSRITIITIMMIVIVIRAQLATLIHIVQFSDIICWRRDDNSIKFSDSV